jgi:hypothetical protein
VLRQAKKRATSRVAGESGRDEYKSGRGDADDGTVTFAAGSTTRRSRFGTSAVDCVITQATRVTVSDLTTSITLEATTHRLPEEECKCCGPFTRP